MQLFDSHFGLSLFVHLAPMHRVTVASSVLVTFGDTCIGALAYRKYILLK